MTETIRTALPRDHADIVRIARLSKMFADEEIAFLSDMIAGDLSGNDDGREWFVSEGAEEVTGAACLAPEPLQTDVRNLLFLGVAPEHRNTGVGRRLIAHAEGLTRAAGARLILIETSSGPAFAAARALYAALGYAQDGQIREYFGPGDDKVIFRKAP